MPCYDCDKPYGEDDWIEAIIPDKIWNQISPNKDQGGILCISCMSRRLKEMGFKDVPVWLCGTEPLRAIEGDPSENIEVLRKFDIK